jgi:hypothetical protein
MRDPLPVRVGGSASNLSHIKFAVIPEGNCALAPRFIEETRWIIEWTAPETEIETAAYLVEVQRGLTTWKSRLMSIWSNPEERARFSEEASEWSEHVLKLSGLLD